MRHPYYDRQGNPISLEEWSRLFEQRLDYSGVARTDVSKGIYVSTVWLGLDHSWSPKGPPLIFETMVFVERDKPLQVWGSKITHEGTEMYRYATEAQALAHHDQLVAELRSQLSVEQLGKRPETEDHE